ncbi:MAG: hypothetical protein IPK98_11300 [Chloracidobacterium sp.]|nr:hypothetical protein [Chloracidobacterium sp.]
MVVIQKPQVRMHQRGLQIFVTHDAGLTWTLCFDVQDFLARKFVLDQNGFGWVVGNRGIDGDASPIAVWTNNGGTTWSRFSTKNAPWSVDEIGGLGAIEDIVVLPNQRVWLVLSSGRIVQLERSGNQWQRRQGYVAKTEGKASITGFDGNSPIVMNAINRSAWDLETVIYFDGATANQSVKIPNTFLQVIICERRIYHSRWN